MIHPNQILIKPRAYKDLEKIYLYSLKEFGSKRADQYVKDLDIAFNQLLGNPKLGTDYSCIHSNLMAYKVMSHLVFYKSSNINLSIIRILHKSMDYERHF
jgi:toxin ParE1/3/4